MQNSHGNFHTMTANGNGRNKKTALKKKPHRFIANSTSLQRPALDINSFIRTRQMT